MIYLLCISVEIDSLKTALDIEQRIDKTLGREAIDAGIGFGVRDLTYEFRTLKAARAAEKRVRALQVPNLDADICEEEN